MAAPRPEALRNLAAACLLALLPAVSAPADPVPPWPPITPEEREITADPRGSQPAVILFEQATVDDRPEGGRLQTIHRRIKIMTPAGLPQARVTITLVEPAQTLVTLAGRTVSADGHETALAGEAVEKRPAADGLSEVAFTLPQAAPGAIVEYSYTIRGGDPPPLGGWTFQHEIPCLKSAYVWQPSLRRTSHWTLVGAELFDPTVEPLTKGAGAESLRAVRFEINKLPAIADEPFSPPLLETRPHLVTTYTDIAAEPAVYWNAFGIAQREKQEAFLSGRAELARRLSAAGPRPEGFDARVRLAYQFVQHAVKNSALGGPAAGVLPGTADSLLAIGVTDPDGINFLFLAALAALDIPATRAFVVDRDRAFFHHEIQSPAQFTRTLVAVTPKEGRALFFAPGVPFTPPGVIPWYAQGVTALLAGARGASFSITPVDPPAANTITRDVKLTLDAAGNATGRITVSFAGQPEMEERLRAATGGPASVTAGFEEEWRRSLPRLAVDSVTVMNLDRDDRNLAVSLAFTSPGFGSDIDNRLLLNLAVFDREEADPFPGGERREPVFFPYARMVSDNLVITLPAEWKIESVPDLIQFENDVGRYQAIWSFDGVRLVYQRNFALNTPHVSFEDYPLVRTLFDRTVEGDATLLPLEPVILKPSKRPK